ncbi:NFIL3 like protein [Sorex araneus]|uniref:NFIL3 like protein n=1 Tax=Sorex araneus TaxID=42254 RepID=UPI002433C61B|nr:NFIL3 like protein [Sorex araneus]
MDSGVALPQVGARGVHARRQREFTPDEKKDSQYWEKRRKNNEAAKRSREKRRLQDAALEGRLAALLRENEALRAELRALRPRAGLGAHGGGARARPLHARLWDPPWPAEPGAGGAEPLSPLPAASQGCLLRAASCPLEAGVPGCCSCLLAHRWAGLASPANAPLPAPRRLDVALPATFFSCQLLDGHGGPGPQFRPCWGLWSPISAGCPAPGASEMLLSPAADPVGLSLPGGKDPEALAQPSLPHKLRLKPCVAGRGSRGWEGARGPL